MSKKTISVTLDGPANALALNKDANFVAVAGRTVFKVFEINDEKFGETFNLRVGKNLNLNFSCNDVAWNQLDENVLATAATNGSVVTWNLQKQSRSKLDVVFNDHKRTVNKVSFHGSEPLLLSGSQDGTMRLFDLRKKEASSTFISNSPSVRDVQFAPNAYSYFHFAAVQETGNVEIWDIRRCDRPDGDFIAHSGPVFACDWHPSGKKRKWLATAGRDKTIKVWDLSNGATKPQLLHCVQTIASVARVKWRPDRDFHIASSSLVVDFGIYIWDVKRPYVPSAIFMEHKDVATGFAWKNDPQVMLSTGKDSTLYQHVINDAFRPSNHYNPIGLSLNPAGRVAFAASDHIIKNSSSTITKELVKSHSVGPNNMISGINIVTPNSTLSNYSGRIIGPALSSLFRHSPDLTEQFRNAVSSLFQFEITPNNESEDPLSMEYFVTIAKEYLLYGKSIAELCEHNAEVATQMNRKNIAQTWRILSQMYHISVRTGTLSGGNAPLGSVSNTNDINDRSETTNPSRHTSGSTVRHFSGNKNKDQSQPQSIEVPSINDDNSDSSDVGESNLFNNERVFQTGGDLFFGCNDPLPQFDSLTLNDFSPIDNYIDVDGDLPREAFLHRHAIVDCAFPPEITDTPNDPSSPTSLEDDYNDDDDTFNRDYVGFFGSNGNETNTFLATKGPQNPVWIFSDLVADMLHFYALRGDVQTSVSILLVLSEKIRSVVDDSIQEQWYHSYIDLLSRFQLWNIVTQVIRLCPLPNINSISHTSTTIYTICGTCGGTLNSRVEWVCDKCKTSSAYCSVCHISVTGLFVWCQGCAHGGHLNHIKEWHEKNHLCPAGCGHQCEYT